MAARLRVSTSGSGPAVARDYADGIATPGFAVTSAGPDVPPVWAPGSGPTPPIIQFSNNSAFASATTYTALAFSLDLAARANKNWMIYADLYVSAQGTDPTADYEFFWELVMMRVLFNGLGQVSSLSVGDLNLASRAQGEFAGFGGGIVIAGWNLASPNIELSLTATTIFEGTGRLNVSMLERKLVELPIP